MLRSEGRSGYFTMFTHVICQIWYVVCFSDSLKDFSIYFPSWLSLIQGFHKCCISQLSLADDLEPPLMWWCVKGRSNRLNQICACTCVCEIMCVNKCMYVCVCVCVCACVLVWTWVLWHFHHSSATLYWSICYWLNWVEELTNVQFFFYCYTVITL